MRPSCRKASSIEFHTQGLGSSEPSRSRACREMAFRSLIRSEHAEQDFKCASCSIVYPPSSSGRTRSNSSQVILPSQRFSDRSSRLSGFFSSARFEKLSQLHPRFVQLGLAVADGTSHHFRNFIVFVTLNIMQQKNHSVSRRQGRDRLLQLQPVDGPGQSRVVRPRFLPWRLLFRLDVLLERNYRKTLLAQLH